MRTGWPEMWRVPAALRGLPVARAPSSSPDGREAGEHVRIGIRSRDLRKAGWPTAWNSTAQRDIRDIRIRRFPSVHMAGP